MNLFVAIPAYDGTVCVETVRALLNEQGVALSAGIDFRVAFISGCSLITMARNQAVTEFLASDADKLVFIDSDVSWEPGELIKLAAHPVDFVGGAYRLKQEAEAYPVGFIEGELWAKDGLLEVDTLPGGFLCLSRKVFDDLKAAFPRPYSHYAYEGNAYFHAPYQHGQLYGEDSAFCHDWRAIGGQVWLDPELSLTHHDKGRAYPGHIGNWLKGR